MHKTKKIIFMSIQENITKSKCFINVIQTVYDKEFSVLRKYVVLNDKIFIHQKKALKFFNFMNHFQVSLL